MSDICYLLEKDREQNIQHLNTISFMFEGYSFPIKDTFLIQKNTYILAWCFLTLLLIPTCRDFYILTTDSLAPTRFLSNWVLSLTPGVSPDLTG